jgi:hypothetical protein
MMRPNFLKTGSVFYPCESESVLSLSGKLRRATNPVSGKKCCVGASAESPARRRFEPPHETPLKPLRRLALGARGRYISADFPDIRRDASQVFVRLR